MKNIIGKYCMVVLGLMLSVVLHAEVVLLNFYADGVHVLENYEAESGVPVTLSSIVSNPSNCRGYNFVGWKQGSPVVPGETPVTVSSVTPMVNMNFYAVYQKAGGVTNRYTRITSTKDLHAGDQYLLVCYYDSDGSTYYGPSFFALGNEEDEGVDGLIHATGDVASAYYDVYATKYSISAEQIYPEAGVYDDPANAIVWTLGGSEDAWSLTNVANVNKKLNIRDGYATSYIYYNGRWTSYYTSPYNDHLLDATGNTFVITSSNGTFNFKAGSYYLSYSDDDNDYFKTGKSNAWDFYLYKKESLYTSYPDCGSWTVHLDAIDGTVDNTGGLQTADLIESGSGVELPSATKPSGDVCGDWTFAGWTPETPIKGTTRMPNLYLAGAIYKPVYDGETLYAVYKKVKSTTSETVYDTTYVKVNSLTNGKEYIIVYNDDGTNQAMGNIENTSIVNSRYHTVAPTTISVNSIGVIEGTQSNDIVWVWNSLNSSFQNVGNSKYIVPRRTGTNNNNYQYYVLNNTRTALTLRWDDEDQKWAIHSGYNRLVYSDDEFWNYYTTGGYIPMFDIYEKTIDTRTVYHYIYTYSSYPHCTPYKVTLHGCGGLINGIDGNFEDVMEESDEHVGEGFTLPSIVVPICDENGEWTFVGWLEGGDMELVEDVDFTGLYNGEFIPSHNNIDLYAIFKRNTDKFRIMYHPSYMAEGDDYIITGYHNLYDWAISSDTRSVNSISYLTSVQTASPQGSNGYYMEVTDQNAVWTMEGLYNACTFRNVGDPTLYLASNASRRTYTSGTASSYAFTYVADDDETFSFRMQDLGTNLYMYFNYNSGNTYFDTYTSGSVIYAYRRLKEYTSWPHCEAFTVHFDPGTGTVSGPSSIEEEEAYAGVTLPDAYANADCGKEGWKFAGWAKSPITSESDELDVDLLPAGSHYRLTSDESTLYAVYYVPEDKFKKITSIDDLKLGVNYIIATTSGNSTGKAVGNTPVADNYIAAENVTAVANEIISDNPAIQWRIQRSSNGEYEFFNASDSLYWDLRSPGYAKLTSKEPLDNFSLVYSGYFEIRSVISLEQNEKYLGYDNTNQRFNTVDKNHLTALYFYRQEAVYHSNPRCIKDADVVEWTRINGETYVSLESFMLSGAPSMDGGVGYPTLQSDGTYKFKYRLPHCSTTTVTWDGTITTLNIPYIMDKPNTIATDSLIGDCSTCDVVVLKGKKLTINDNTTLHAVTLHDSATLDIDDVTLSVKSLILRANTDTMAPMVNLNTSGEIELEYDELYYDLRIAPDRFYWISLPFNARLREISYSNEAANGGIPAHWNNYYVYFYNGKLRAEDANGGAQASTYWTPVSTVGKDYTMRAGQGYLFGLADEEVGQFPGQTYPHTKRVMRFTMNPPLSTWLNDERTAGYKISTVSPSVAINPKNAVHAGWNLIGNPYLHAYRTGTVSGLKNGKWTREKIGDYETKFWILDGSTTTVPYVTLYNPNDNTYRQELASNRTLHPFEAVFVQINEGPGLKFQNDNMNVLASAPAYIRVQDADVPVRTGITLSGVGDSDKTGFVLSDEYTPQYEIGADLQKMYAGNLNIYSLNADKQELAFNGLSEENAIDPIQLGYSCVKAGEYTFSFDAAQYDYSELESLTLIDKTAGVSTDLLSGDYTVSLSRGTNKTRFAILIRLAKQPQVPTGIDELNRAEQPHKIIRNGQLFILKGDDVFNAVGTKIR